MHSRPPELIHLTDLKLDALSTALPPLPLRTCAPKGLHFMTTSCPKKRQLGVDSARADLTTASRDRVEPIPQSQAEEGEKEYSVGSRGWLHTRKTQSALFALGNCSALDLKGLPFPEVNPVQTTRKQRAEVLRPHPCLSHLAGIHATQYWSHWTYLLPPWNKQEHSKFGVPLSPYLSLPSLWGSTPFSEHLLSITSRCPKSASSLIPHPKPPSQKTLRI